MKPDEFYAAVYRYLKSRGYWWIVPELSYCCWSGDFIAWGKGKGILEVEIKQTWADYKKDFTKSVCSPLVKIYNYHRYGMRCNMRCKIERELSKYRWLLGSYPCAWRPTHFTFAAPVELAERIKDDPDRPKQFGVISVREISRRCVDKEPVKFMVADNIEPVRRLMKIRPEMLGRFKGDLFTRAMWAMDSFYEYKYPE